MTTPTVLPLLPPANLKDSLGPGISHARKDSESSIISLTSSTSRMFSSSLSQPSTPASTSMATETTITSPTRTSMRTHTPSSSQSKNDIFSTPSKEWFVKPAAAPPAAMAESSMDAEQGMWSKAEMGSSGISASKADKGNGGDWYMGGNKDSWRREFEATADPSGSGSGSESPVSTFRHTKSASAPIFPLNSLGTGTAPSSSSTPYNHSYPSGSIGLSPRPSKSPHRRRRTNTLDSTSEEPDLSSIDISHHHDLNQSSPQPPTHPLPHDRDRKPTLAPVLTRQTRAISSAWGHRSHTHSLSTDSSPSPSPPNTSIVTPTSPTRPSGTQRGLPPNKDGSLSTSGQGYASPDIESENDQKVEIRFARDDKGKIRGNTLLGQGRHGAVYLARYHKRERARTGTVRAGTFEIGADQRKSCEELEWEVCAAKVFDADEGGRMEAVKEAGMLRYLHEEEGDRVRGDCEGQSTEDGGMDDSGRRCIVGYKGLTTDVYSPSEVNDGAYRAERMTVPPPKLPAYGQVLATRAPSDHRKRRECQIYEKGMDINGIAAFLQLDQEPTIPRSVLVLEYCPKGTVERFLHNQGDRMDGALWRKWYRQGEAALRWCHERNVVHCDVKPGNLLLDSDLDIRLSDFNSALLIDPQDPPSDGVGRGTLAYASPEVVDPSPDHTFSFDTDLFSFGVTMWQCLTGLEPYAGMRAVETIYHVRKGKFWDWAQERMLQEEARRVELGHTRMGADLHRGGSLRVGNSKGRDLDQQLNMRRSSLSGDRLVQRGWNEGQNLNGGAAERECGLRWDRRGELLEAIWHLVRSYKRAFVTFGAVQ